MSHFLKNNMIHNKIAILLVSLIALFVSLALTVIGNFYNNSNTIYIGIVILFVMFITRYLCNIKESIIILFFNASIFFFLLGRYLVRMINNIPMDADPQYIVTALNLVFVSLLSLNLAYIATRPGQTKKRNYSLKNKHNVDFFNRIRLFTNAGLIISGFCMAAVSVSTYVYAWHNGYVSLYSGLNLPIPSFIKIIADMLPFFVALSLARLPSKKISYTILLSYTVLQLPLLMAGKRMPFMIAILVWISYVVIRHHKASLNEKWITKKEKLAVAILIPTIIFIIPFIGDVRGGNHTRSNALEKTLDSQGVTLDVVSFGIMFQEEAPRSVYGSYTFAPLFDYISTNSVSRKIFSTSKITPQTLESARLSTNYADTISYMTLWEKSYLAGQGLGSSYIVELYLDFGIVGLIIYSIFIALLIRWMTDHFGESHLSTFIIVLFMINIYSLPRDTATGFIVAATQVQTIGLLVIAFLYNRFICDYRSAHE